MIWDWKAEHTVRIHGVCKIFAKTRSYSLFLLLEMPQSYCLTLFTIPFSQSHQYASELNPSCEMQQDKQTISKFSSPFDQTSNHKSWHYCAINSSVIMLPISNVLMFCFALLQSKRKIVNGWNSCEKKMWITMLIGCMLTLTTHTHLILNYPHNNYEPITNALHSIKTLMYC